MDTQTYEVAKIISGEQFRFNAYVGRTIVNDVKQQLTLDQATALCDTMKAIDKGGQYAVVKKEQPEP